MAQDFKVTTALRYDPRLRRVTDISAGNASWNQKYASPFYMLDYHRDRMLRAATHWGWTSVISLLSGDSGLAQLEEFIATGLKDIGEEPMKVRITLTEDGHLELDSTTIAHRPLVNLDFPVLLVEHLIHLEVRARATQRVVNLSLVLPVRADLRP